MSGSYEIRYTAGAARQVRKLDRRAQQRVLATIEILATDPRPPAATRLVDGDREWRVRTGDFRVVYEIDDGVLVVLVVAVGHRREVHR